MPVAAAFVVGAIGFAAAWLLHRPAPAPLLRASIELPPRMDFDPQNTSLALSPDGSTLAIVAERRGREERQLWVRRMDGFAVQPLAGTDDAICPFWSPDSRFIGFFADHKLKKVPASGGTVQTICDAPDGRGASWSVNGRHRLRAGSFRRTVEGLGGRRQPHAADATGQGGRHGPACPGFSPAASGSSTFREPRPRTRRRRKRHRRNGSRFGKDDARREGGERGTVRGPGYLLFVREGNLMAQPLRTPSSFKTTGEAVPIAEHVRFTAPRWSGNFSASAYRTARLSHEGSLATQDPVDLVRHGRQGAGKGRRARKRRTVQSLSGRNAGRGDDSWAARAVRLRKSGSTTFLGASVHASTFGGPGDFFPVWSPDGKQVAFGEVGSGIFVKAADGTAEPKALWSAKTNTWPLSWSPDGKFSSSGSRNRRREASTSGCAARGRAPARRPLIATPAEEIDASISPGRKVAHVHLQRVRPSRDLRGPLSGPRREAPGSSTAALTAALGR